jgi:hypothetical protein
VNYIKNLFAMKTLRTLSNRFSKILIPFVMLALLLNGHTSNAKSTVINVPKPERDQKIMLALLLDTSNSMDGLIDQAKSQLWKIVNELAGARCDDGDRPGIQIALYEYGNDNLPSSEGYIRLVSPLTSDLDLISEKLFALTTNGGNEYCGYVINKSLKQLDWSSSKADLKMIFIAGNEPFTQGPIPYYAACQLAKEKDVVVNTIHCGDYSVGVETSWKRGADLTGGNYMAIEQNRKTIYIPTPYDARIDALNIQLNNTYIFYGSSGARKKEAQQEQDRNAGAYGESNKAERAISKSSHAYKNSSWDLVDAAKDSDKVVEETEAENLPKEMQGMTVSERKAYVNEKSAERGKIQKEIQQLAEKRRQYIAAQPKSQTESSLDGAMLKSIKEEAQRKNLKWN